MIRRYGIILLTISISVYLTSCECSRKADIPPATLERIHEIGNMKRFEKDLFSLNIDSVSAGIPMLEKKYGEFFDMFNYRIVRLGSPASPGYPEELKRFITDYYMNLDYRKVMEVYPDVKDISMELQEAFRNYVSYFPQGVVPYVYTCISGWNQSVVASDTILGIALDKYLGRNCEYYTKLGLAEYMKYTMEKSYIVTDCMRDWAYTRFNYNDSADNILHKMLYEGKVMYFVKKMLPNTNDTIIFGFKPEQLKWCNSNISNMWTYLIENKMLYSTDFMTITKLMGPAPFTAFFGADSPGRATVWLGYKIIEAYMSGNDNVTLQRLMTDEDYGKILRKSAFEP